MKKVVSFVIFFIFVMLIIPALSLLSSSSIIENKNLLPNDIDKRFYIIQDHNTMENMTLTPSEYIRGVVAAEIPISFHEEAIKAQVIAAHTYAIRQIGIEIKNPTPELNGAYLSTDYKKYQAYISDDELKEKWGDSFDENYKKLTKCVDSVIDKVIAYNNEPIVAAFHGISGGQTENSKNVWGQELPYLVPANSDGDELSPSFKQTLILTESEVGHLLKEKFPEILLDEDRNKWFNILTTSESNNILEIQVGSVKTSGNVIRAILNLRSANFTVSFEDGLFTFTTLGYGHGVGMSQYGSDFMARQGKNYSEILTHYYNGVEIKSI